MSLHSHFYTHEGGCYWLDSYSLVVCHGYFYKPAALIPMWYNCLDCMNSPTISAQPELCDRRVGENRRSIMKDWCYMNFLKGLTFQHSIFCVSYSQQNCEVSLAWRKLVETQSHFAFSYNFFTTSESKCYYHQKQACSTLYCECVLSKTKFVRV